MKTINRRSSIKMNEIILVLSIFLLIFSSSGCDIFTSILGIDPVENPNPDNPDGKKIGSSNEKIKADLTNGQLYIVTLDEFDKKKSTFNFKISNNRAFPLLDNNGGIK